MKFKDFFGLNKKKPEMYSGIQPYTSLKDIEEGKLYTDTLKSRLRGEGVGYDPKILSASTAPFAQRARTDFQQQVVPMISQQASARGVGRSTIPVNRIAVEQGRMESDIAQRIADIELKNEMQKRAEINAALGGLGQFAQAEAGQRTTAAGFERGSFNQLNQDRNAWDESQTAGLNKAVGLGASILAAPFTGGASLLQIPNVMGGGTMSAEEGKGLLDMINKALLKIS